MNVIQKSQSLHLQVYNVLIHKVWILNDGEKLISLHEKWAKRCSTYIKGLNINSIVEFQQKCIEVKSLRISKVHLFLNRCFTMFS